MENFELSPLFNIEGISAASGLVYKDNKLYIISDSSSYLYEYDIAVEKLNKIALVKNAQENIIKKDKPDFESITLKDEKLLILGSGSTATRNTMIAFDLKSKEATIQSLDEVYSLIKSEHSITDSELNIEGYIVTDETVYYFQRGNGTQGKNGIFFSKGDTEKPKFIFVPFDLPPINSVATTFTDAILVQDTIYFLATAEDTNSTYGDGEILGSSIGTIDLKTMALQYYFQISQKHKFEGLTLYKKTATHIELLLCEDNDTDELVSTIYKLTIEL